MSNYDAIEEYLLGSGACRALCGISIKIKSSSDTFLRMHPHH